MTTNDVRKAVRYPYGAKPQRGGFIFGLSLVWDKSLAQWFVDRANDNPKQAYGWWRVVPLPSIIEE